MIKIPDSFWSFEKADLLSNLQSTDNGLSSSEAKNRIQSFGLNSLKAQKKTDSLSLLIAQFKSPIILILLFATGLSFYLGDTTEASIILFIIMVSGLLGFWQERGATNAVAKLLEIVQIKCSVIRDGKEIEIPLENIVPGDVVALRAGDIVPGDSYILESKDLFVNEAMLTGETFPVEKSISKLEKEATLSQRTNSVWMGTHVVSGNAKAMVVLTAKKTEFGKVSEKLKETHKETNFETGIKHFGFLLMQITFMLVVAIFIANIYLHRPLLDSFLFSLALAVGLTPQLLPAIISINLSHGAKKMAENKVIVKRLASIENLGSMNIICSDKTGTLTEGTVTVQSIVNIDNQQSEKGELYSFINASFESGFINPIDEAIRNYKKIDLSKFSKLDEIPYDFLRKRLSILFSSDSAKIMVSKGALSNILEVCKNVELPDGSISNLNDSKDKIQKLFEEFSSNGNRTLGIAYKEIKSDKIVKDDEKDMTFLGFLVLFDPPKPNIIETIQSLKKLGVSLKIITGDNQLVAQSVGKQMGLANTKILTGAQILKMSDDALKMKAQTTDIFAEIEPNQKEKIILSLQKCGNVVGYIGDGINDTSALHAADVGISVDSAVDVAKEAADIVLLEKDLSVLINGVTEGRMTFSNTLKYVFMATSANFGNMFSMAGASLFLKYLPLLPTQILLTNLLTDIPEMTIATDTVDKELIEYPRRWDIAAIRKFMITFGILSSVFDYASFGALLLILHASEVQFRTGWFLESVISASMIVLVIRSRKPIFNSKPGKYLFMSTMLIFVTTIILPYTPLGKLFGFAPLPLIFLGLIGTIVLLYIISAEVTKYYFYKYVKI